VISKVKHCPRGLKQNKYKLTNKSNNNVFEYI